MFDPAETLTSDLLRPIRAQLSELSAEAAGETDHRTMARGLNQEHVAAELTSIPGDRLRGADDELLELQNLVTDLLPWVSKADGAPVGMWVEGAGRVETQFEPYPIGTPYVWVAASTWDAAQAVYEALVSIARLDAARWIGGWQTLEPEARMIKIYPALPRSAAA